MQSYDALISWSGSKKTQAIQIINYFPKEIDTYYEIFCGSCSILFSLLNQKWNIKTYVANDLNSDLIQLWQLIQSDPQSLFQSYKKHYAKLNLDTEYYYDIRNKFNKNHDPFLFFFLNRTCVNGLIRYNKQNEFNSPLNVQQHAKPITPKNLLPILLDYSHKIQKVKFINNTYSNIIPNNSNDFVYADPPYIDSEPMYYGTIDYNLFFKYLNQLKCNYGFSFSDFTKCELQIPNSTFSYKFRFETAKSAWNNIHIQKKRIKTEYESFYLQNNRIKYPIKTQTTLF